MPSVTWDVRCLNGKAKELPQCSFEEFCHALGIEKPTYAKQYLCYLAGHYRKSGKKELPKACKVTAEIYNKDKYIMWVWMITSDFRCELDGMPMELDEEDPDSYYLLYVMRKECKGQLKDWAQLAQQSIEDKKHYTTVKMSVASMIGMRHYVTVDQYED